MRRVIGLLGVLLLTSSLHAEEYKVGVASGDITPKYAVRLNGFGGRRTESEGVTQPIKVKALAIEDESKAVALLMTVDILGIPAEIRAEVGKRLEKKAGLKPARLCITASHTHTAPMLKGANVTLFGLPIPKEHLANIDKYTTEFVDKLEQVALAALKERTPARLSWGIGQVGFAKNRRQNGGPVDHDLPTLIVRDPKGKVRAVFVSYACHCVTLSNNKISGDWAGYAQQAIEDAFPGAVALVSIGCGADANPASGVTGGNTDAASKQGAEIATEVERLARNYLAPVTGKVAIREKLVELPLAKHPDRAGWEKLAERKDAVGHHARTQLEKLDRKESLPTKIDYLVQTWTFGDGLALVFLPGEVVVDFSVRLKRELDCGRLAVIAYANDDPCYIPSERILKEGGYEGGAAMVYYDVPTPFAPGMEAKIVDAVHALIGKDFAAPHDATKLQNTRPLSPQQSLAALKTRPNMSAELVAAEPLVVDPVAIDFGPDGKLWVAEMCDYPAGKSGKFEPGGRVRWLTDRNGDGTFDEATVFLDNIPFPTGITVWKKGVLVCAAPDVLYAEDTNGDGKADVIEKILSGFGTENYQARVNSLQYGLDGWVYGSCGLFGGTIKVKGREKPFVLGNRDFRFRPDTGAIEAVTGTTQQGRVGDERGNWFGCDNSTLLRHYALTDHYLRRNPHVAPPAPSVYVPDYPNSNRLYPAREVQQFKLTGPAHQVTSACGLGLYRDDLLGSDFRGNAFVCEPVNLVVHRLQLSAKGNTFGGQRAAVEQTAEFLASTDNWFRPVQVKTGPDGCLWVVDMYRFVIEHPRWIPPNELAQVDARAGSTRGRLYRIRPKETAARAWPRLDKLDTAGLVAALDSPSAWQRDLAGQMLLWDAKKGAAKDLEKLFASGKRPEARLHALCVLGNLGELRAEIVATALQDADPAVRQHAVRLAEGHLSKVGEKLPPLVDDKDPLVRLQLAYTLGEWHDQRGGKALAQLALQVGADRFLIAAVISSVRADNLATLLGAVLPAKNAPTGLIQGLVRLAVLLDDGKHLPDVVARVTKADGEQWAAWQLQALATLLDTAERGHPDHLKVIVKEGAQILAHARKVAGDGKALEVNRLGALALLGRGSEDIELLADLLQPKSPLAIQTAALAALLRSGDAGIKPLLAAYRSLSPGLKTVLLDGLLSRAFGQGALLESLEKRAIPPGEIDLPRRQRLLTSADKEVRARAGKVFESGDPDRQKVVRDYDKALALKGKADNGKAIYAKHCAACHQFLDSGHAVGPDLNALAVKTPPYLLSEILDPNRNVDARYLEYLVTLGNGKTVSGLMANETATSITLRGQEAKEQVLLRKEIDALTGSGKSLMPEGLEKVIPHQDMADLLAYLTSAPTPFKRVPGNTPAVVKLDKGRLTLKATECEIRGGDITLEQDFKQIGNWHGNLDNVLWRVELEKEGTFDVWLDYSCSNDCAGNRWVLEGAKEAVKGTVAGTGGWDKFRTVKIGTVTVGAGKQALVFRPDGAMTRRALLDLRTLILVPPGEKP